MEGARVVVKPSSIHGKGVFAAIDFNPGDIILRLDDSRLGLPLEIQIEYLPYLSQEYRDRFSEQVGALRNEIDRRKRRSRARSS